MGVLRAEPFKVESWTARSMVSIWRAYDFQLTTYALLLAAFGLAMAYSNSVVGGGDAFASGSTFVRGLMWAAIAGVAFILATVFDYKWLRTFAWPVYFLNLGLLALTLAVGKGVGEAAASRWVSIMGFQFQFSELAKILTIVALASFLASRGDKIGSVWTVVGALGLVAPALVLVMKQPDLGTSLVFGAIVVGMLFMSGASLMWLAALGASAAAALPFAWGMLQEYQQQRLLSFLNPAADPTGAGYQLNQALIAVGSGGWLGKGLTNSTQNALDYLPVQTSDFVWSILAEELGFLGCVVVLLLFVALLWRILVCSWRSTDPFARSLAAGLASLVVFQLFVNVGMVIGIMPVTGIPLPFVSSGGASLVSLGVGLGLLQSINLRRDRPEW